MYVSAEELLGIHQLKKPSGTWRWVMGEEGLVERLGHCKNLGWVFKDCAGLIFVCYFIGRGKDLSPTGSLQCMRQWEARSGQRWKPRTTSGPPLGGKDLRS